MAITTVEVNAWTLRCMFNESHILKRRENGEFTMTRTKSRPSKKPDHPKDTKSEHLLFRDNNGDEVATAHWYLFPTGETTPADPKTLTIQGIRYTIHPDPTVANPENRLPFVWMRRWYGWLRREIVCPLFGPLSVLPEGAPPQCFATVLALSGD
jgi:hypothetical protein